MQITLQILNITLNVVTAIGLIFLYRAFEIRRAQVSNRLDNILAYTQRIPEVKAIALEVKEITLDQKINGNTNSGKTTPKTDSGS